MKKIVFISVVWFVLCLGCEVKSESKQDSNYSYELRNKDKLFDKKWYLRMIRMVNIEGHSNSDTIYNLSSLDLEHDTDRNCLVENGSIIIEFKKSGEMKFNKDKQKIHWKLDKKNLKIEGEIKYNALFDFNTDYNILRLKDHFLVLYKIYYTKDEKPSLLVKYHFYDYEYFKEKRENDLKYEDTLDYIEL